MAKETVNMVTSGSTTHTAGNKWNIFQLFDINSRLNALPRDDEQAKLIRIKGQCSVRSYTTETGTYNFDPNWPMHMWIIAIMVQTAGAPANGVSNSNEDNLEKVLNDLVGDEYAYQVLGQTDIKFSSFGLYGTDYLNLAQMSANWAFQPKKSQQIVGSEAGSATVTFGVYCLIRHTGNSSVVQYNRYQAVARLEYLISQRKIKLGEWQG